ncbi:MAG: hypothetical protein HC890_08555 [Chloroflexaceae bacterium]|nr:hypothetical protein [Chloroflexaceae bacterium]
MLGIVLLLLPTYAVSQIPQRLGFFPGTAPSLYKFLQQQPKDTLIATLASEGDFIPTFAQRSVLAAAEYSIPYHWGYYAKLRQRIMDNISAQYSQDLSAIKAFIVQYNLQFWLVAKNAFFVSYLTNNPWLMQYQPAASQAIANLNANKKPILPQLKPCTVFEDENNYLLQTDCILKATESIPAD